ncbi:MAG: 50S ribosomal protein L21 [bacterium]|nr:50S ribosomal protein L21 [bacterium]
MYAIVQTGGKQFQVSPGDILEVEKLKADAGEEILLDQVLLIRDGENLQIGKPTVANAAVKAKVMAHDRGKKVIVFKLKRRKNYRRKKGHRQDFTRIRVVEIVTG